MTVENTFKNQQPEPVVRLKSMVMHANFWVKPIGHQKCLQSSIKCSNRCNLSSSTFWSQELELIYSITKSSISAGRTKGTSNLEFFESTHIVPLFVMSAIPAIISHYARGCQTSVIH